MTTVLPQVGDARPPFELPALPYAENALDPYVSSKTLSFHHGKHHRAYIEATNRAVSGTQLAELTLEELIRTVAQNPDDSAIFNVAAQAWNHAFYWRSLRPKGGGAPSGEVLERIERSFGDFDRFKTSLAAAAAGRFGSGWAWIVADGRGIAVETTHDADTPIARGRVPLATIDVWEHAYYLDYQNRRPAYVSAVIEHLLDWSFVGENLSRAEG